MLFDPATSSHLKPWLVRTLGPICDAEPTALAEYVLALLKHNLPEPEMRKELTAQLEEFLEKEGPSFIDTLFTVLRTKSYLPYTTSSPPHQSSSSTDAGIPIPLDSLLSNSERAQKRTHPDDDRDALHPAKGPRLTVDGQFSRYATGQDPRSTGQWGPRNDRQGPTNGAALPVNGQRIQTYQPPDQRRGICRDYHNNGYCARGALCKYSHGDDAFVPSQLFSLGAPGPQMPFLPMFAPGAMPFGMVPPGVAYDPLEARMDMRPGGNIMNINNGRAPPIRPPIIRRAKEDTSQSGRTSGELPVIQDLTPQVPDDPSATASKPPPPLPLPLPPQDGAAWMHNPALLPQVQAMDVDSPVMPQHPPVTSGGARGGFRGGGRGTFPGDAQSFRPERRNDKTLVVEKIPEDKLSLDAVNSWFKRFGTVTNVAIDVRTAKALVSFAEHTEAHAAWKSEDAVFGNRFVKVFWHRPMEGHGQKGTRMLAASAPLVANITARNTTPATPTAATGPPSTAPVRKPVAVASNAAVELAAKQKLLEEQIAEQKSLMASLATASGEEKKTIMARLRKLGEEMKPSSSPGSISGEASSHSTSATQRPASSVEHPVQNHKERERLDKELDLHAVRDNESTADLQAKLAKLKEEAASLGIPESGDQSYGGGSYRPYRGRGRGARGSFFRGAGRGALRGSMKLDNRPKKLLIKGVREDAIPTLREWYETPGQLDSVDSVGGDEVLVGFRTRAAAEQALAKGSDIPSVGVVQVSWHAAQQWSFPSSQTLAASTSQPDVAENGSEVAHPPSSPILQERPSTLTLRQEEEIIASGWGDGGEEDDMGFR